MGGYLSVPILLLAVLVQATILPELRILGGMPDLVFMLVLAYDLMAGFERGVVWAIVGGLLHDLLSAVPLGTTSLALVMTTALASFVLGRLAPGNLLYPPLAAGIGTFVLHTVTLAVLSLAGRSLPFASTLMSVTVPTAIYNLVGMFVVYRIVGGFFVSGRPRRVESIQQ